MNLQRGSIFILVLFKRRATDQGVVLVWPRLSGAGSKRQISGPVQNNSAGPGPPVPAKIRHKISSFWLLSGFFYCE